MKKDYEWDRTEITEKWATTKPHKATRKGPTEVGLLYKKLHDEGKTVTEIVSITGKTRQRVIESLTRQNIKPNE